MALSNAGWSKPGGIPSALDRARISDRGRMSLIRPLSGSRSRPTDQQTVTSGSRASVTGPRMLSQAFSSRRNSLGFLRYLFAALVVVDHSFPLSGLNGGLDPLWTWSRGQDSLGGLAVTGFFVISGFLVTRSWCNSQSAGRYIWRRFLRIFPGFWVCLLVTAFVLAPLAWIHERGDLAGYFHSSAATPAGYVLHNGMLWMHQYNIAGLLSSTPYAQTAGHPLAWNGSLWTLIYEFKCYLLVAVLGVTGLLSRHRGVVLVLFAGFFVAAVSYQIDPTWAGRALPMFNDPFVGRFGFEFFLGSACALYAERIEIDDRLAVLAGVVYLVTLHEGGLIMLGYPALAYLCLYLAVRLPIVGFDRHGDFSYGTYIYAFPLQQLLALHGLQRHGIAAFIGVSLVAATGAAFLSWHLVEKPALRLKNWTPGRSSFRRRPRLPPPGPPLAERRLAETAAPAPARAN